MDNIEIHLDGDTNGHGIYLGPGGTRSRRPPESREKLLRGRFGKPVLAALGIEALRMFGRADGTNLSGVDHYAHFWSDTILVSQAAIAGIRAAAREAEGLNARWEDEACRVMLAAALAFEAAGGRAPDESESTFGGQSAVLRRIPGGWETVSGGFASARVVC